MLKLDTFRLFVDQRLAAATDDIFRRFARIITEYEGEVYRLKQEVDRKERLLERTGRPEDGTEDTLCGVQIFPIEEESQASQSFSPNFQQDEGGALRPEGADTRISECSDWLREGPEPDRSHLANEIHNFREEVGLRPSIDKQDAAIVKQEVGEGCLMVESAARSERSPQQEAVQQTVTTEEERPARGRYFSLHIKPVEGGASGLHDGVTKLTQTPDWPMETCKDEGSSSNHIQFHGEEGLCHSDHSIGSAFQSEPCSDEGHDAQLDLDFQTTVGNRTPPPGDQNLLVCGSCGREFSSKQTLNKHIRQNTSQDQDQMSCSRRRQRVPFQNPVKSFRCSVCGGFFSTQGILVRHAEIHCKEPESRCGACGDYLGSTEILRDHLRSHKELGRTCDVCGKKCSSIKRMEIHKRVHTGEKPYSCGFCCRHFSRKESLERHLQVHSGDRPHSCGLCWRTFTRREYLVQHLQTSHKESQGPPAETKPSCTTPAGGDSVA